MTLLPDTFPRGLARRLGRAQRWPAARAWAAGLRAAALTFALSLPQGLLALPVAFARAGLLPGLLIALAVGALNVLTMALTARAALAYIAAGRGAPSLTRMARERLGPAGGLLALAGGAVLFFMGLLASLVGLARSLAELSGLPALAWAAISGLALLLAVGRRATLSLRLLVGLGLLNAGLIGAVLVLALPSARLAALPAAGAQPPLPLPLVGVCLMLFFAPMLVAPLAQQATRAGEQRGFVWGSALGVAAGALLFVLWALLICAAVGPAALVHLQGTPLPALAAAAPATRLPGALLGLLLLGMTALRCAIVLHNLAGEHLPPGCRGPRRQGLLLLPIILAVGLASALLGLSLSSFTSLIALAGASGAALTSVAVPAMLAWRAARR